MPAETRVWFMSVLNSSSSSHLSGERTESVELRACPAITGLKGMRVAMVCFSSYPADPRPRRAVEALLSEGAAVDFICLADDKSARQESAGQLYVRRLNIEHRRGGPVSYALQYAAFIIACAFILAVRAIKKRYDLVYVHNMPDILVLSAVVPKVLGAKVLLDQHDPMPELMATIFRVSEGSLAMRMIKQAERWSLRYADLILAVNIACKQIFSNRGCRVEKIGIVMNAPDEKIFVATQPCIRRSAGRSGPFVIMYHGSIVERNGLDLAIEAFARVQANIPAVELRIYGRATPFLERVMAEVRSRGLQTHIHYMGPRSLEQLVTEIGSCDLGIIPNHKNAFTEINTPTRIFEYLSLGKPVVAPRSAGICDYFDDRSMLFFDLGNAEDLARKIEYALSNPAEVVEIVQRGQDVYRKHTWKAERRRLINLVEGLVSGRRSRLSDEIEEEPVAEANGMVERG